MRILFLGNNAVAVQVMEWLRGQGAELAGLVIHPETRQKFAAELVAKSGLPPERIFDGSTLRDPRTMGQISALGADIGVSVYFGYMLTGEFIRKFTHGVINLHPSYLPYNRGAYPNVWPIIEGTPAGVSLHFMDEGVDTGDLIAQREIPLLPTDTGATLHRRLEEESVRLFTETWPSIAALEVPRIPQCPKAGSFRKIKDVAGIDAIDPDRLYRAQDLIDLIRARTFPPYKGAYLAANGKKVYLRLELEEE
jgi:methionyl-tRNA formyltransferase